MVIKKLKLNSIFPADYNPRVIGEIERNYLSQCLDLFGPIEPIIVNESTLNIVGGHQRYSLLLEKGVIETDCVIVSLSDEEEKALNLTLNNVSIQGKFSDMTDVLLKSVKEYKVDNLFDKLGFSILEKELEKQIVKNGREKLNPKEVKCPCCDMKWEYDERDCIDISTLDQ